MKLHELFSDIPCSIVGGDAEVTAIECDSRNVGPGCLFACVVGTFQDGHQYAAAAAEQGASALLVERELPIGLPQVVVEDSRKALALAASAFYGHPSKKMRMVGVTGTNGKTTTTYMLKAVAERAGYKVGLIGTIRNLIGETVIPANHTTPDAAELHRILRRMADEGVEVCIMEVSSHSLVQHRVYGIDYDVAVFTNLTQDHLDYHKTFDNYLAAKRILFLQAKKAVVNCDDPHWKKLLEGTSCELLTFAVRENSDIYAKNIDITPAGAAFDMHLPGTEEMQHIKLRISGLFSVFNAMGTAGAAMELGISPDCIKAGLESVTSVSGRIEALPVPGREFSVILDYAHTPDALENILKTVRCFTANRLIVLFGCGGDRDRAKRPIMGEVAGRYSDFCIVTSDNPRSEEPRSIMLAIEEGVKRSGCDYIMIENRREAIQAALKMGQKGDVIVLAGKGHETYQEINGVKNHFDEKEIVAELVKQL